MSTITQRIPNFLLGISQQPDNLKFPGQLVDSVNTFPDYSLGLLKRPGGKFVAELYNATPSGRWFSILRDDAEKYVAQYSSNIFRIWSIVDGLPRAVNMGTNAGVPGTCNITNVKSTLNNYNTAKLLTKQRLGELNSADATYAKVSAGQYTTEGVLLEVETDYPYGDVEQSIVNGIYINANATSNQYVIKVAGAIVGNYASPASFPSGYEIGSNRANEYPILARQGFYVYELVKTTAAANTSGELTAAQAALTTAQNNYTAAVADEATKKGLYDTQINNCAVTTTPSTAYLYGASATDIEVLTLNDYTFVLNKKKVAAMKASTVAALPNQAFVVISVVAYNAKYTVTLNGTDYSHQTPADVTGGVTDSNTIATALVAAINASGAGFTATKVGPGLKITKSTAFTISTTGSATEEGIYCFQDKIESIGRLPNQCSNGYKVKIVNTTDVDADDMWVVFNTTNSAGTGPGVWEETNAPGVTYAIDELTMPHQLVRQSDGSFTYEPVIWEDRAVGDDTTNPIPSFIGQTISSIFFYRNRLGFLSNESVVLSKAGDYFNFFATTAQTVTADDPIDVTATSTRPVTLSYVQATNVGLLLFGRNEQFLLSTDATDVLSPQTANINTFSKYECDPNLEAVSLGNSVTFLSKTALYTRLFELTRIRSDMPPSVANLTTTVSEFIPAAIDNFIASPVLSLLSMGQTGSSTVYQYRFLQEGDERNVNTWYKWELTGTFLDQFFDNNTYFAVTSNGSKVSVNSFDLTQASEQGYLTLPSGEKTDVCLDMFTINPYRSYNSTTEITRVYLPYNNFTGKQLSAVLLGSYIGISSTSTNQSVGAILYPTVQGTTGSYYVELDGDYRGRDLIIGYTYEMLLELPKFYQGQQQDKRWVTDTTAELIIHRIKVFTGLSGPVTYKVNITGKDEWVDVVNVTLPYQYVLNNVNLSAENTHVVPIYQRNKNLRIRIVGDTPFPVSLLGCTWEGLYKRRFYTRN
jgi:hypothetical protein